MKKSLKGRLFAIILSLVMIFTLLPVSMIIANATETEEYTEGLSFQLIMNATTRENYYKVTAYDGSEMNVVIPNYYMGSPVRDIGSRVFESKPIVSIKLPEALTTIGANAFYNCTKLESIEFPDNLERIYGDSAFYGCSSLKQIVFGSHLYEISNQAFFECTSLESVYLPDSLTTLGMSAFMKCSNLKTVTGGKGLQSIGSQAFSNCDSLESFTIGDNVNTIGTNTFSNCINLKSISLGSGLKSIGNSAFTRCQSLERVYFNNGIETIKNNAFNYCSKLKEVYFPATLNSIDYYAFNGCELLTDVYFRGTEAQFAEIEINPNYNDYLLNATIHYNFSCSHGNITTIPAIEPTCEKKGYTSGQSCELCGQIIVEPQERPALGHEWNTVTYNWSQDNLSCQATRVCKRDATHIETAIGTVSKQQIKNPSCEEEGVIECNATFMESWATSQTATIMLPAIGTHSLQKHDGKNATCTENGVKEYWSCSVCNKNYSDAEAKSEITDPINTWKVIKAKGHKLSWYHKDSFGKDAYDLICLECKKNFGRGYKNSDGYYYIYDFNSTRVRQHLVYDKNAQLIRTESCKAVSWTHNDEKTHDAVCKCHLILAEAEAHRIVQIVTPATSKSDGFIKKTCSKCGFVNYSTIKKIKTISLKYTSTTYTGKNLKPGVTVKDAAGKTISSSNYTVTYSNNKNVGTATVTIKFKGKYSGTIKKTFAINPKTTTVKKLKVASKKLTVYVNKQTSQTTGYIVQVAKDKKFTKGSITATIKKNTSTSVTIKSLKGKTKYYVRVRTFKTIGKKKFYSGWKVYSKTATTIK